MKTQATHTHIIRALLLLGLIFSLAACSWGLDTEDAESALKAAFEGELDEANKFFCEGDQLSEMVDFSEGITFVEATCERQDANMFCAAIFSHADGSISEFDIVFKVRQNKLCQPSIPN